MQHGTGRVVLKDPVLYKDKKVETTTGGQPDGKTDRRRIRQANEGRQRDHRRREAAERNEIYAYGGNWNIFKVSHPSERT